MIRYCIRRVILMIPVLGIIVALSFFFYQFSGADPVRSILAHEGMIESNQVGFDYRAEYKKVAEELHRDDPTFYLSVVPSFFPDTLHKIVLPTQREFANSLLLEYKDWNAITDYMDQLAQMTPYIHNNSTSKNLKRAILQYQDQTDKGIITRIQKSIQDEVRLSEPELATQFHSLHEAQDELFLNTSALYFPKLQFHGKDNQFHHWAFQVLKGDFGLAMADGRPVIDKLKKSLNWTIFLSLSAIFLVGILSIFIGYIAALYHNTIIDISISIGLFILFSMPTFWFATLMIVYFTTDEFGSWTNIFPTSGTFYTGDGGFLAQIAHNASSLILPILCLSVQSIAYLGRQVYSSLIQESGKAYFSSALQKGMSRSKAIRLHALPNALLPFITIIIGAIPASLAGSLVIEILFNIPGMGRLMFMSIQNSDWNVISAILIVIAVATMMFFLLGDILYALVNPKIDLNK